MSELKHYPEREIERGCRTARCQIIYSKSLPWVCYDIERGDQFLAKERMGTMMEIELSAFRHEQDTRTSNTEALEAEFEVIENAICHAPIPLGHRAAIAVSRARKALGGEG